MTAVAPDELLAALPVEPPEDVAAPADRKPKRPTTRAGRREAAAARKAQASAAGAGAPPKDKAPRESKPAAGREVAESVKFLHELLGGAVLPIAGLPITGQALAASGADAGKVWADVAKRYPAVARLFGGASDGVVFFRLLMVYAPVVSIAMGERAARAGAPAGTDPFAGLAAFMGGDTMGGAGPFAPAPTPAQGDTGQNAGGRP